MGGVLVVNFKTYPAGIGKKAVETAKRIVRASRARTYLAPPFLELPAVARAVGRRAGIVAQHIDPVPEGHFTGHVVAESVKEWGASGSIVNHSERRMAWKDIARAVSILSSLGMESIVCVPTYREVGRASRLNPTYIAVEPPELIAGRVSVSRAEPWVIEKAAERTDIPLLCGAGIHSMRDVERAMDLGASGILVSSAIMKSRDPESVVARLSAPLSVR